jgi:DNA repair protein RecO (recombination protein O)
VTSLQAVLLRRVRFSDTSLIVTWFSDAHGKIKVAAKGALRPKSPFAGKLDLFYHCELFVSFSKRSEIHTLREVVVRESFDRIRSQYLKTLTAAYFCELVEAVTELDHPVVEIYQLLLRALNYLHTRPVETRAVLFFESELCKCLGLTSPNIHSATDRLVDAYGRLPRSRVDLFDKLTQ